MKLRFAPIAIKELILTCVLALLITGCLLTRTRQESFVSLHSRVKQTLGESSDCGPVLTNEVFAGRYFEVTPRPHGLLIYVFERPFFTRKEWVRRYTSGTNLLDQFLALTNHDVQTAQRFSGITNGFGLLDLPEWSYQGAGIDVKVQDADESYPGLEEDAAQAQARYEEIIQLLKPYLHANPQGGGNGRQPFSSGTNRTSAAAGSGGSP